MRRKSAGNQSDRELLDACRVGALSFEVFYRRHRESVLAFHAHRTTDPELAADLMAETFAAALKAIHDPSSETPEHPLRWLFTIAHNKLIDSYRKGRVEDEARLLLALEPLTLEDADIDRINQLEQRTDVAMELARQLPADQFEAVRARILEDRSYSEIAGELECSEAVVRMRVSRGLKTLRSAMEAHND